MTDSPSRTSLLIEQVGPVPRRVIKHPAADLIVGRVFETNRPQSRVVEADYFRPGIGHKEG